MDSSTMETLPENNSGLNRVKFFILLILQIPSILITLFLFTFFLTHRTLLHIPQNQSLIILLVINFLSVSADLPMIIHYYHLGRVDPATASYCTWWTFFEYSLNLIGELLIATISIQRHILIFQAHILQNRSKRFILYYLPLLLCLIYPVIVYLSIIVFYPCDGTQWDFSSKVCGYANCYLVYSKGLSTYDLAVNNGLPIFVVIAANAALIIRVIRQKHRQQRVISWKKQRRMTIQLFRVSSLYLFAWLPCLTIGVCQQLIYPSFLAEIQFNYALDFPYFICLLLPWICLGLMRDVTKWIRSQLHCEGTTRNRVVPA